MPQKWADFHPNARYCTSRGLAGQTRLKLSHRPSTNPGIISTRSILTTRSSSKSSHRHNLVEELRAGNAERAAFEASWLAHSLTDGLTPAHHFPYEETLVELRKGEGIETRTSPKEKLIMKGDTKTELMRNNWRMWGFKGLFISHAAFEMGIAAIVSPFVFRQVEINKDLIAQLDEVGFQEYYLRKMREIAVWDMYDEFTRFGWTWSLSKRTRDDLVPIIIEVVSLSWYSAMREAGITTRLK